MSRVNYYQRMRTPSISLVSSRKWGVVPEQLVDARHRYSEGLRSS